MKKFFVFIYVLSFCLLLFGACHDVNAATVDTSSCSNIFVTYGSRYAATDGAYTVCNTQTKMNNYTGKEYSTYGFTLFSNKNVKTNTYARFKGDGTSDLSGYIDKEFSESQMTSLQEDYGWTQEEVSYLYYNITYLEFIDSPNTQQYSEIAPSASVDVSIENASFLDIVNAVKSALLNKKTFEKVPNPDDEKLPLLNFSFSKKFGVRLQNDFAYYNLHTTWNYKEKDIYNENPDRYRLEIRTGLTTQDALSSTGNVITTGTAKLSTNKYSFSIDDAAADVAKNNNLMASNIKVMVVFVRITDSEGYYSPSDYRSIVIQNPTGVPIIVDSECNFDNDGNVVNKSEEQKQADKNSINNSGTEKDPDGANTDSKNDTSSSQYKADYSSSDPSAFISTIKSIVSNLGSIPVLIAQVYSWLPNDLIALIGSMIALIVVVGVVKWVL